MEVADRTADFGKLYRGATLFLERMLEGVGSLGAIVFGMLVDELGKLDGVFFSGCLWIGIGKFSAVLFSEMHLEGRCG